MHQVADKDVTIAEDDEVALPIDDIERAAKDEQTWPEKPAVEQFVDGMPVWERMQNETDFGYRMFLAYRNLRHWTDTRSRTLPDLLRSLGRNHRSTEMYKTARRFRWAERAIAWDDYERRGYEAAARASYAEVAAAQARVAKTAIDVAHAALVASGKTWLAHSQQGAQTLAPDDAARAATAAGTILAQIVRPSMPSEFRNGPDVTVQATVTGNVSAAPVVVNVSEAAAQAFIDAAARISDDQRPVIDMGYAGAIEAEARETDETATTTEDQGPSS